MQRARRQALREHRGRGHRRRGHERGRAHARDALDERQQHAGFADARAMQPDERARRTGKAAQPRRSPTRRESSLPRLRRIASIGPANGVARNEANR